MILSSDPQARGFSLQDLLRDSFKYFQITVANSFTRNEGGEQIDGAFVLDGRHYIVECRWRERVANMREVDGLLGQVRRSGAGTMGIYFSINGWSENVPLLLKQNPDKVVLLMDSKDFRAILTGDIIAQDLIQEKTNELSIKC